MGRNLDCKKCGHYMGRMRIRSVKDGLLRCRKCKTDHTIIIKKIKEKRSG